MADTPALPSQVVVVGSSAGGVEALSTLVSTLPADFPAPVVIAQHLDPQRPSHLAEILARHCALPVQAVTGQEALAAGRVYVLPSDHQVEMRGGHLTTPQAWGRASDQGAPRAAARARPTPSINALFRSAANAFGDGVIAVVLSGTGSDGADGALEVKKAGGTVVIQNPETASYPAMPLSLSPNAVDLVANAEDMGPLLHGLLTGATELEQSASDGALHTLLTQVRKHTGLDFAGYRTPTILRRIARRMAATGCSSLASYRDYLRHHPEEYPRLVSAFLIKVTEFFRDPQVFDALRTDILPNVLATARKRGKQVRIWSAGCATGEEAYTLAILVAELLGPELEQFSVRIFATDLDHESIAYARRGRYPAAALSDVPPDLVSRYFTPVDDDFEIAKHIRSLVVFGEHNLLQRAPFPHIDVVLCRNVLMYLTADLQQRVLQVFAYSLRDGGYLVLGKAEVSNPLPQYFAPVHKALRFYQRQGERLAIPVNQFLDALPPLGATPTATSSQPLGRFVPPPRVPRERAHLPTLGERLGATMLDFPVGLVIVDRHYDVQAINTLALRLLGIHREALGDDLLHLARGVPMEALRDLIDSALSGAGPSLSPQTMTATMETGERRSLQFTAYPHRLKGPSDLADSVLLLVSDVTASVQAEAEAVRQREEHAHAQQATAAGTALKPEAQVAALAEQSRSLAEQIRRVSAVNQELREANQAYARTILELRQEHEAIQVDAEELQAALEEVETLNEELQATNEELETLNEELQATVEELHTANEDLEARGRDQMEMAATQERMRLESERERARLAMILAGMADAVLVVDATGRPILTNAAYDHMFGGKGVGEGGGGGATLPPAQMEFQDEHGQPLSAEATPWQRATRGETFSMVFMRADAQENSRWYEAHGQPLPTQAGVVLGAVVLIRDISDRSLRHLQEAFLATASHELRSPLSALSMGLQLAEKRLASLAFPDEDKASVKRALKMTADAAQSMEALVSDLVDAARLRSGKLRLDVRPIDLVPLVRESVERAQLLAANGQQIALTANTPALMVRGDAMRLKQAFMNLLTNAITYAPNTPRIDVRLRQTRGKVGIAELQVQDYGLGIAAADLAQIFSRYYQVAREERGEPQTSAGLGLGLYIARELVTAQGGEITVTSTQGKGATFTVRLPLLPANEAPAAQPS